MRWYKWIGVWKCVFADILYNFSQKETKEIIDADVNRYLTNSSFNVRHKNRILILNYLLLSWDKTFRNVFYYRVKVHKFLVYLSKILLPEIEGIEISGEIEEGLYLSHNYMVVHPEKAGKNLRVGPGVVIGKNKGRFPVIGNNVYIAANSTVIGNITIGDNVIIGANSFVNQNLENNAIYGGNPARLLKKVGSDEIAAIVEGIDL